MPLRENVLRRVDLHAGPEPVPDDRAGQASDPATYHDVVRLIERLHRRFLDLIRSELPRLGVDDLAPAQALMVMHIGEGEPSVRELMERGHYVGSNASYALKALVAAGYVNRDPLPHDRRSARLSLTEKGRKLYEGLSQAERQQAEALVRSADEGREVEATYRTLRRLERLWGDLIRYGSVDGI